MIHIGKIPNSFSRDSYWKDTKLDYYLIGGIFLPFPFNAEVTMSLRDTMDGLAFKTVDVHVTSL